MQNATGIKTFPPFFRDRAELFIKPLVFIGLKIGYIYSYRSSLALTPCLFSNIQGSWGVFRTFFEIIY